MLLSIIVYERYTRYTTASTGIFPKREPWSESRVSYYPTLTHLRLGARLYGQAELISDVEQSVSTDKGNKPGYGCSYLQLRVSVMGPSHKYAGLERNGK